MGKKEGPLLLRKKVKKDHQRKKVLQSVRKVLHQEGGEKINFDSERK